MKTLPAMFRRGARILGGMLVLLFLSSEARAIWEKYSPFEPGRAPRRFPLTVLRGEAQHDAEWSRFVFQFSRPGERTAALRLEWGEAGDRVSVLSAPGERRFSAPLMGSPLCEAEASTTDLNGDRQPDYIVVTHSGGNGLAAQITYIHFILSSDAGYVARQVVSYDAAPVDLVDLNGDGRPEFVHCMSVWGDKGKDGKAHNYWAYNLIGFSGTSLVSANADTRDFPKWIAYTHAENHRDSAQLTAEQRERQWRLEWLDGGPFPDLGTFTREQGRALQRP